MIFTENVVCSISLLLPVPLRGCLYRLLHFHCNIYHLKLLMFTIEYSNESKCLICWVNKDEKKNMQSQSYHAHAASFE